MPQKEIDIVINDRDIEQSEKKLRKLDKMLQQTQRRAAVLGRTRMTPVISLDDRFSTKARLISHRITLLDRMSANPIVWLIDNASERISKIRDSLVQLTKTPWRVSVVGMPLANLFGDDSLYKELGKKAGDSYFESFLAAINSQKITFNLNQTFTGNPGNDQDEPAGDKEPGWIDKILGFLGDIAKGIAQDYIKDYIEKLLGKKDSGVTKCICICKCGGGRGGGMYGGDYGSPEGGKKGNKNKNGRRNGRFRNRASGQADVDPGRSPRRMGAGPRSGTRGMRRFGGGRLGATLPGAIGGMGSLLGKGKDWIAKKTPGWIDGGKNLASKGTSWAKDMGSKMLEKGGKSLSKSKQWLGKGTKWLGKAGKLARLPGLGVALDVASIATADSNRDKTKAATSAILSGVGGTLGGAAGTFLGPGVGNFVGAAVGSVAGGYVGDKLGGFLYDSYSSLSGLFKKKKAPKIDDIATKTQAVDNVLNNTQPILPEGLRSSYTPQNTVQAQTPASPPQINVSVSQDAINLTVQKDDINYDDIAQKTGSMIANQVRFAMMNMS
ncbi:hypothetical protein M3201_13580 [Paenibacillus motobuensis]|uniref:hypothetical protein n=1 Tax=Paenibacillus TaxID=44249 RepID=UPI00203F0AEA|nr:MULTISPECIES: hypothetical protein [Paenibacillus]MCM3040729.1 hypothetical protein [Paenibacillus lutimineralis]MCM3647833.1 hypothetical protein [Paenibacillus motobuensis]